MREIQEHLRAAPNAARFELIQEWAVRASDLQAALLRHQPHVVHFSGHGEPTAAGAALVIEDEAGHAQMEGLAALAFLPASGFGASLGAAVSGLSPDDFADLVDAAVRLSLLTEVTSPRRPDRAWCLQPLLGELLRGRAKRSAERTERTTAWFLPRMATPPGGSTAASGARWAEVDLERDALAAWLAELPAAEALRVQQAAVDFAVGNGPCAAWLACADRMAAAASTPEARGVALGLLCQVALRAGALDRAEQAAQEKVRLDRARGDERGAALAMTIIGDVRFTRGDLRAALRTVREELLPAWDRLGDVRQRAVALRKSAIALRALGERDEALRVLREEVVPALDGLGDDRERALAVALVALIIKARGEIDEALRLLRDEVLPVFERLGDDRERVVAQRKVADLLARRGEIDEALRVLREDVVPAFARLGHARERSGWRQICSPAAASPRRRSRSCARTSPRRSRGSAIRASSSLPTPPSPRP